MKARFSLSARTRVCDVPPARTAVLTCALLASLASLTSCSTSSVTDLPAVESIELTPPGATLEAGRTLALLARPLDADGTVVTARTVVWSSSNTQLATVSNAGVVTARAAGEVRIAASAGGQSAVATITVLAREVASVQVTPVALSVRVRRTAPLEARALDAEGQILSDRTIVWSTNDPTIATVSAQGVVTGVAAGATTITATTAGRSGQAAITVTPEPVATVTVAPARDTLAVGLDLELTATVYSADGAVLSDRSVAWSVSDPEVASVSSAGVVTALTPGSATVSAVSEGRVGQSAIVVLARLANAITVLPGTSTIEVGGSVTLATQITDPNGNLIPDRVVVYSSDNTSAATVSQQGVVSGHAAGVARITATSDGRSATATVTVINVPVATVQIVPATSDLQPGGSRLLSVQARSSSGALLSGRAVAWISGASAFATVSSGGLVLGVAPGVAVIAATVEGVTGFATITVRAPVVATVAVSPSPATVAVNDQLMLSATALTESGAAIPGRLFTWTTSNPQVAFVSGSGTVIGVSAGTAIISATTGGVSGTSMVTVR